MSATWCQCASVCAIILRVIERPLVSQSPVDAHEIHNTCPHIAMLKSTRTQCGFSPFEHSHCNVLFFKNIIQFMINYFDKQNINVLEFKLHHRPIALIDFLRIMSITMSNCQFWTCRNTQIGFVFNKKKINFYKHNET